MCVENSVENAKGILMWHIRPINNRRPVNKFKEQLITPEVPKGRRVGRGRFYDFKRFRRAMQLENKLKNLLSHLLLSALGRP